MHHSVTHVQVTQQFFCIVWVLLLIWMKVRIFYSCNLGTFLVSKRCLVYSYGKLRRKKKNPKQLIYIVLLLFISFLCICLKHTSCSFWIMYLCLVTSLVEVSHCPNWLEIHIICWKFQSLEFLLWAVVPHRSWRNITRETKQKIWLTNWIADPTFKTRAPGMLCNSWPL